MGDKPTTGNEQIDEAIEALQDAASDMATSRARLSEAQHRLEQDEKEYAEAANRLRLLLVAAQAPSKGSP